MKKHLKSLVVAAVVAVASLASAQTNTAEARIRILSGRSEGACINGTVFIYHWGLFGSGFTENEYAC